MAFGNKYTATFYNYSGASISIIFAQEGYGGSTSNIELADKPIILSTGSPNDDPYDPIRPTIAHIRLIGTSRGQFAEFFTSNAREWRIALLIDSTLYYLGFLLPDQYTEPYCETDYICTLIAQDGLQDMQGIKYLNAGARYTGLDTANSIIRKCLTLAGMTATYNDFLVTYDDSMNTANPVLTQVQFYQEAFFDESINEAWSCYDVLAEILRPLGAILQKSNYGGVAYGCNIFEPHTLKADTVTGHGINSSGTDVSSPSETTYKTIGSGTVLIYADTVLSYKERFGKSIVEYDRGLRENYLKNGYFDRYTAGIPDHWSTSSVGLTVTEASYAVTLDGQTAAPYDYLYTEIEGFINYGSRSTGYGYYNDLDVSFEYVTSWSGGTTALHLVIKMTMVGGSTYYWNGTNWTAVDSEIDLGNPVSGTAYTYSETLPYLIDPDYTQTLQIRLRVIERGAGGTGGTITYRNVKISSTFSNEYSNKFFLDDPVRKEYTIDSTINKFPEPVLLLFGSPSNNYDLTWRSVYDQAGNLTDNWSISGEAYTSDLQTLLARKIGLQYKGKVHRWEGSLLNTTSMNYYSPYCIRDAELTNEYSEAISMFPVYTEHDIEGDIITGLFTEIRESLHIT